VSKPDFAAAIEALAKYGVDFLVVGGVGLPLLRSALAEKRRRE